MNHGKKLITVFIKTMEETHTLYKLDLIDLNEFRLTKIAAINITLYSIEHYEPEEVEYAIIYLYNSGVISKEEYWQIKARLTICKRAA